jgi:hypothetical protein
MHKQFLAALLLLFLLFIGCNEPEKSVPGSIVPSAKREIPIPAPPATNQQNNNLLWADSLLEIYIAQTNNPFVAAAKKDSVLITTIFNGVEKRDSATYLIYQLGHSFEDHYVTEQWIYIDSITRVIYQYDLPADTLIKWK